MDSIGFDLNEPETTGTTCIAMQYDKGIVLISDRQSTTGSFISDRHRNKIFRLTDNIIGAAAGNVASMQMIVHHIKARIDFYEMEIGKPISVLAAANIMRNFIYANQSFLDCNIILAGSDSKKGPQIYAIKSFAVYTSKLQTIGSGAVYTLGFLDDFIAGHEDIKRDEAIEACLQALKLAKARDSSSGFGTNIGIIESEGIQVKEYSEFGVETKLGL